MMMLDVVIDPAAVRGERWFLGDLFYYAEGGVYFGVPLSNFAGWWLVGAIGVFAYEACARPGRSREPDRVEAGIALYYAVFVFNLAVTGWIGERKLAAIGFALHALMALAIVTIARRAPARRILDTRRIERA
jgi:putative membrane protein